jgi:hypothetical protein
MGQVPVVVRIGEIVFTTALFPRERDYFLPLRDAVRSSAGIELDPVVLVCPGPARPGRGRLSVVMEGSRGAEPTRARP